MTGINWDTVNWKFDERSLADTAKAVLLFNPKPWEGYDPETLIEQMKRTYRVECRRENKVVCWVGTGGYYVCGTYLTYKDAIFVIATLSSDIVLKAIQKASETQEVVEEEEKKEEEGWRYREAKRFESDYYKPVPWADDIHWQEWVTQKPQCDHFVHISLTGGDAIAYIKNEENGKNDVKTRISPEKYMEKFVRGEYREYIDEWLEYWWEEA